jgi:peptidoglycan hydrolase CwlO-like protein
MTDLLCAGFPAEEEIKDLRNDIAQLKQQLKSQTEKLKAAKQEAEQYRSIAQDVENKLRESNQVRTM